MPFHNEAVIKEFLQHLKSEKFDYVIQIGDLYDFYSQSRFARSHDLMTPSEEVKAAVNAGVSFWNQVKKISPKAHCYQLRGNHDERPIKRLLENAPELWAFFKIDDMFRFPGVTVMPNQQKELIINDIYFMHGHYGRLGQHAQFNLHNTVHGHTHRGGVVFFPHRGQTIFELDVGYAADATAVPLRYGMQTLSKWTLGWGAIDNMGPRFIPYN